MITTAGTLNLNDVIIQNNYSFNFGIISTSPGAMVNVTDAQILHNACTQNSGLAVNASGAGIVINMNKGTIIDGNHGIFKVYSSAVLNIEDSMIPLAVLPMTGDVSVIWMLISLISGLGLAGVFLADRRKRIGRNQGFDMGLRLLETINKYMNEGLDKSEIIDRVENSFQSRTK